MNRENKTLRILLIAEACNPEWPSLPGVGYKAAKAIAVQTDTVIATHVRNRNAISSRKESSGHFVFVDNEYIAKPAYHLGTLLRGGNRVGWTTNIALAYPSYLGFELEVWKKFKTDLQKGRFDIVHRLTPMSPTLPSPLARLSPVPFIIGPLNGGLKWPPGFRNELFREREWLTYLRKFHTLLPYWRSTYQRAAAVLAGFSHTMLDLQPIAHNRLINFPEVGFDPALFYDSFPSTRKDKLTILFVGRLVPYKCPDILVNCFASSEKLRRHHLLIVGEGPDQPRLEKLVYDHCLTKVVTIAGYRSQAQIALIMRNADIFAFPSIRELGAGVVVEAMASGLPCIVVDYGGPGGLIDNSRGIKVPLGSKKDIIQNFTRALESLVPDTDRIDALGRNAAAYAKSNYTWEAKARSMIEVYRWVMGLRTEKPNLFNDSYQKTPSSV